MTPPKITNYQSSNLTPPPARKAREPVIGGARIGEVVLGEKSNWIEFIGLVDWDNSGEVHIDKVRIERDAIFSFWRVIDDYIYHFHPFLRISDLDITGNSILFLKNADMELGNIYIKDQGARTVEALRHIAFEDSDGQWKRPRWELVDGYYSIMETGSGWLKDRHILEPWTPLPEPTTYGTGLAVVALGTLALRRKSRLKLRPRCTNFFD